MFAVIFYCTSIGGKKNVKGTSAIARYLSINTKITIQDHQHQHWPSSQRTLDNVLGVKDVRRIFIEGVRT